MTSLTAVYEGWDGYHLSLVKAVAPLTPDQLAFRSVSDMRSVGELALHISHGRMDWFRRLSAYGSDALFAEMEARQGAGGDFSADELVMWLDRSWKVVTATLDRWTVADLDVTFEHRYHDTLFAVSRQWVIWRIMAHDIHHGGQLSELLAMQGIVPLELTLLGGHLTEPPVIHPSST